MTLWSWTASVALHLVLLGVFAAVRFSGAQGVNEEGRGAVVGIKRVRLLAEMPQVIPKPKVEQKRAAEIGASANKLLAADGVSASGTVKSEVKAGFSAPIVSREMSGAQDGYALPVGIEFFGSHTEARKVCYVVDCSGSMLGVFSRVQARLKASIGRLAADHYFYVILFGGGRLIESGDGRLLRATEEAKSAAYKLTDSVRAAGGTNTAAAIERALQIRDEQGRSVSVVYFLTDGFELSSGDAEVFLQRVMNLQKQFAPSTKINTIGFWPQSSDRELLEAIAGQSGGEAVLVGDGGP